MSEASPESNQDSNNESAPAGPTISDRASDFMSQANEMLGKVDWSQMKQIRSPKNLILLLKH